MSEERRHSADEVLGRIDERTASLVTSVQEIREHYVTRAEFKPIRTIVYGAVGIVGTAFVGALVRFAFK